MTKQALHNNINNKSNIPAMTVGRTDEKKW